MMDEIKNNSEIQKLPKKKTGLALGIICNGLVPVKWMMHMLDFGKSLPGGLYWSYVYTIADFAKNPEKNYATSRTEIVEKALEMNVKWLFFVDSDVFLPYDAVDKLMSHKKEISTGVYWMKKEPPQPVIYQNIGDGPIWEIEPKKDLMEIGGAGLGCCLIDMEVFEKFKEKGIPFFKQDWVHTLPNGRQIHVNVGEDHWFFEKARELGYKVWCDTNVLCDHYAVGTDTMFPGEKVVREISAKRLKLEGRQDILDHQINVRNVDKTKPTIVFFNASSVEFDGDSIKNKPISGSETAIIQMAKNFKDLEWNVHVFCNTPQEGYFNKVGYHKSGQVSTGIEEIRKETEKVVDVFISSRDVRPFLSYRPPVKHTALWIHDMPFVSGYEKLLDALPNIDYLLFLSKAQVDAFQEKFDNKIPKEKIIMTRNGIDEDLFVNNKGIKKQRGKCIYTTTPFRGLDVLFDIWPQIKEKVPEAELHVFSGMSIYNQKESSQTQNILDAGKNLESKGVFMHNPVTQDMLAEIMMGADVMLYPNHYPETYCITAIESIKAKTPIVTSYNAALPEVINSDEGILIQGKAGDAEYNQNFVAAATRLLTDDSFRNSFCTKEKDFSWKTIAKEWEKLFSKETDVNSSPGYWERKHKIDSSGIVMHQGRQERCDYLAKLMPKNGYIMDVGFGDARLLKTLYDNHIGVSLSGAEISEEAIRQGKEKVPLADFTKISSEPCDLPANNLDIITAIHLVEHLKNPEEYIKTWSKSLKPGGEILLVIPLDDLDYFEHLKIYNLGDIEELAKKVTDDYEIKTRDQLWNYTDGRKAKEAIVRLFFK